MALVDGKSSVEHMLGLGIRFISIRLGSVISLTFIASPLSRRVKALDEFNLLPCYATVYLSRLRRRQRV